MKERNGTGDKIIEIFVESAFFINYMNRNILDHFSFEEIKRICFIISGKEFESEEHYLACLKQSNELSKEKKKELKEIAARIIEKRGEVISEPLNEIIYPKLNKNIDLNKLRRLYEEEMKQLEKKEIGKYDYYSNKYIIDKLIDIINSFVAPFPLVTFQHIMDFLRAICLYNHYFFYS